MKRETWIALLCGVLAVGGACGGGDDDDDDGDDQPDASPGDEPDAAPGASHTGQALLLDLAFQNLPELGRGVLLELLFQDKAETKAFSYEESPGSPFACKVTEFTPEDFEPPGVDEGTFQYTVAGGPEFPPCTYVPEEGYRCIGVTGAGGDIAVVDAKMDLFSLTNPKVTFGADEVGRLLDISGSANPSNNGQFPIVDAAGDNTIIFVNQTPGAAAEKGTAAEYLTLAGVGLAEQNEILADDAQVTFALNASDGAVAEDFSRPIDIGDAFVIDDASADLIAAIPTDGSSFTIGCDGEGGSCGVATASLLQIVATDGDISQVPPFVLPPPRKKATTVFCVFLALSVTVNQASSQYIADVGATRIRAVFGRANNQFFAQQNVEMLIAAGHALGGITDPRAAR
jgi:hypothetical protein